jgi:uncharacterized protein (DUF58 family)
LGEDARKIDWKSTAKTGVPHVKLFFQEREVNVALCALMSGSLLFRRKKETLLEVCSLLGYEAVKLSNRLIPVVISDETVIMQPSKKIHSVKHFILKLDNMPLYKKDVNLQNLKLKQKSLVILVGDFLGDYDLSFLASRHEVFVVIIRERFEEKPEILGDGEFTDPESGESREFYFGKSVKEAYAKKYKENDYKLYKHLNRLKISYVKIITDKDVYMQLLQSKSNQ